jgi:hypothetical protein
MVDQVLFILCNGMISQWNLSRGKLVAVTVHGQHKMPYSAETAKAYWDEWNEDNMVAEGDIYDAIFLSDALNDFGELPKWICANSKDKSVWTIEQLSLLASEAEYKEIGLCLVQGNVKRLIGTEEADDAIELYLKSSLAFTLPKEVAETKVQPKEPPKQPAEEAIIADSYNDAKALILKVGDKLVCVITRVSSLRGCCYLKSDKTADLIRVKLPSSGLGLSGKGCNLEIGMELTVEVIAVTDKVVQYKITV